MTKKKKSQQQHLSPEQFIKQRMRKVELGECYISKNFKEAGEGNIVVTRKHTGGKVSIGIYLVDIFCLGLKDSYYILRVTKEDFENQFVHGYFEEFDRISYNEAHNYIYGAIAYAEEAGIRAHLSFNLTQYFLEEDDENIPLIEYDFGKDGQHYLVTHSEYEADAYLPTLQRNLGDDFKYIIVHDKDKDKDINEEDNDELEGEMEYSNALDNVTAKHIDEILEKASFLEGGDNLTPYTYERPKYLQRLILKNKSLKELIFNAPTSYYLSHEKIQEILSLPHDILKVDLEKIVNYSLGQAQNKTYEELESKGINNAIAHAIILLAEIGDKDSLNVVLEAMRQPEDVSDKLFGDLREDIFIPTIYQLGKNHLEVLLNFAKEPGLYTYLHYIVYPTLTLLAYKEPERRDEVIKWYKDLLLFATEHLDSYKIFDPTMTAFIVSELVDIKAKELLSEIKAIFETRVIDSGVCGKYESVEKELNDPNYPTGIYDNALDVYGRYEHLCLTYKED